MPSGFFKIIKNGIEYLVEIVDADARKEIVSLKDELATLESKIPTGDGSGNSGTIDSTLSTKFALLVEYIRTHVVNDDNGAGLDSIISGGGGSDTPVTPPSQTVTVSQSGSTLNITGFTATAVSQSGSTLNVA